MMIKDKYTEEHLKNDKTFAILQEQYMSKDTLNFMTELREKKREMYHQIGNQNKLSFLDFEI
jgi:hypothetical protein